MRAPAVEEVHRHAGRPSPHRGRGRGRERGVGEGPRAGSIPATDGARGWGAGIGCPCGPCRRVRRRDGAAVGTVGGPPASGSTRSQHPPPAPGVEVERPRAPSDPDPRRDRPAQDTLGQGPWPRSTCARHPRAGSVAEVDRREAASDTDRRAGHRLRAPSGTHRGGGRPAQPTRIGRAAGVATWTLPVAFHHTTTPGPRLAPRHRAAARGSHRTRLAPRCPCCRSSWPFRPWPLPR